MTQTRFVSAEGSSEGTYEIAADGTCSLLEEGIQFTVEARPGGYTELMVKRPGLPMLKFRVGAFSLTLDLLAKIPWDDEAKRWTE